jgi:NADPH2:quinone reductase
MPEVPTAGTVRVRVAAASVNPVDLTTRAGVNISEADARFPMVLGWDVSGTITQVGRGAESWAIGDRVAAMLFQPEDQRGTYRSIIDLDADEVSKVPDAVDLKAAATVPLAGLTARQLIERAGVERGDTILINAPLGAVGRFATQLAAARGARVIGIASKGRAHQAESLGVDIVLARGFSSEDVRQLVPAGVDIAIDLVGGSVAHATFGAVRDGGTYVTSVPPYVDASGVFESERGVDLELLTVHTDPRALSDLFERVGRGEISTIIEQEYPLAKAAEAHRRQSQGGLSGKIILVP